jgi:hypothetical protein
VARGYHSSQVQCDVSLRVLQIARLRSDSHSVTLSVSNNMCILFECSPFYHINQSVHFGLLFGAGLLRGQYLVRQDQLHCVLSSSYQRGNGVLVKQEAFQDGRAGALYVNAHYEFQYPAGDPPLRGSLTAVSVLVSRSTAMA